jgi:hypothetical protein
MEGWPEFHLVNLETIKEVGLDILKTIGSLATHHLRHEPHIGEHFYSHHKHEELIDKYFPKEPDGS